jgi:IS30 family transposase
MKKETKASKIMKYIASHPTAKAKDVAKAIKVSVNSVYQTTYLAKKGVKSNLSSVPRKRGRPFKKNTWSVASVSTSNKSITMTVDAVNHPPHYKAGGIETIDFIEAKSLNYNLGNVVKYITRADHKGNKLEDLRKAQWYLNREISNLEKK